MVQPPLQRRREAPEVRVPERGPDPLVRVGPEGVQVGAEGASEQDRVLREKVEKIKNCGTHLVGKGKRSVYMVFRPPYTVSSIVGEMRRVPLQIF